MSLLLRYDPSDGSVRNVGETGPSGRVSCGDGPDGDGFALGIIDAPATGSAVVARSKLVVPGNGDRDAPGQVAAPAGEQPEFTPMDTLELIRACESPREVLALWAMTVLLVQRSTADLPHLPDVTLLQEAVDLAREVTDAMAAAGWVKRSEDEDEDDGEEPAEPS